MQQLIRAGSVWQSVWQAQHPPPPQKIQKNEALDERRRHRLQSPKMQGPQPPSKIPLPHSSHSPMPSHPILESQPPERLSQEASQEPQSQSLKQPTGITPPWYIDGWTNPAGVTYPLASKSISAWRTGAWENAGTMPNVQLRAKAAATSSENVFG
jgi:hypothetical protein